MNFRILAPLTALFFSSIIHAQVLSPNSQEILFSYETEFIADEEGYSHLEMAEAHSNYLFGVMHSSEMTAEFGIDTNLIEGAGSPRSDMTVRVIRSARFGSGQNTRLRIRYSNRGRMLVHSKVATRILRDGSWELPMPIDATEAYDKKCTDHHYQDFGDYWYFWNPYRSGCEYLQATPYSQMVSLRITAPRARKTELSPRLDLLRGANGNGDAFSVYVVHGFADSATDPRDESRQNYEEFTEYLKDKGFAETIRHAGFRRPLRVYNKEMNIPGGRRIQVEIKSLLAETGVDDRGVTFARFFKEAVESGDVIFYAGHSGLGGNLDIPTLQEEAGGFRFPKNKRQIFFFDSCSSYSYYLAPFAAEKTKARIDVITYALSSYFYSGNKTLQVFMDILLSNRINDMPWMDLLRRVERPLDGESYLLSVGGI